MIVDGSVAPLGGPQTIRAVRSSRTSAADMPIVALIGGDGDDVDACNVAGADAALRKPVSVSGVARALAGANGLRQIRRAARTAPPQAAVA